MCVYCNSVERYNVESKYNTPTLKKIYTKFVICLTSIKRFYFLTWPTSKRGKWINCRIFFFWFNWPLSVVSTTPGHGLGGGPKPINPLTYTGRCLISGFDGPKGVFRRGRLLKPNHVYIRHADQFCCCHSISLYYIILSTVFFFVLPDCTRRERYI